MSSAVVFVLCGAAEARAGAVAAAGKPAAAEQRGEANQQEILSGAWQIAAIGGKRAVAGMGGALPSVEFSKQGLSGHSGCNGFGAAMAAQGRQVKFSGLSATMMACPPAIMKQEQRLYEAFAAVRSYRQGARGRGKQGGKAAAEGLRLVDGRGRVVLLLVRK